MTDLYETMQFFWGAWWWWFKVKESEGWLGKSCILIYPSAKFKLSHNESQTTISIG